MSDELKPCPFCKGKAYIHEHYTFGGYVPNNYPHNEPLGYTVGCSTFDCRGKRENSGFMYETVDEAIAAWNTRADDAGECEQEEFGWGTEGDHARVWLTCGHDCMVATVADLPNYCPTCGVKVRKPEPQVITHGDKDMDMSKSVHMCPNEDSREKLEADIRRWMQEFVGLIRYDECLVEKPFNWLDRQAAITERELCAKCDWPSLAAMPDIEQQNRIAEQDRRIVEYAEQVDELTAERAKLAKQREILQGALDIAVQNETKLEAERDHWKDQYQYAVDQEQIWREGCEALEAERDELERANERQAKKLHDVCNRNEELEAELARKQRVIDTMRDSFLKLEIENTALRKELEQCGNSSQD